MKIRTNDGFTIIELMIAITILSVILLMSAVILTGVGNLFYKGVNMSNVQDVNRNIVQDVSSTIQFGGSQLNNGVNNGQSPIQATYAGGIQVEAYCLGTIRYSFVTGFNSWPHVLWKDQMQNQNSCYPLNISEVNPSCDSVSSSICSPSQSNGTELVGHNMHLANFQITSYNTQLYGIEVGLAAGFKDMFVSDAYGNPVLAGGENYTCNNKAGQQYCATSFLKTLATERLSQ